MAVECKFINGKCEQCGKSATVHRGAIVRRPCPKRVRTELVRTEPRPPQPTMFAEIPCRFRYRVHDEEVPAPCCGGTALVEFAECLRGKCSVRGINQTAACLGCKLLPAD